MLRQPSGARGTQQRRWWERHILYTAGRRACSSSLPWNNCLRPTCADRQSPSNKYRLRNSSFTYMIDFLVFLSIVLRDHSIHLLSPDYWTRHHCFTQYLFFFDPQLLSKGASRAYFIHIISLFVLNTEFQLHICLHLLPLLTWTFFIYICMHG